MNQFRLRDWNDIKLLLACAEHGGFAGAAVALGIDQTTVSRRVAMLEAAVGRPLFSRRRSGASPTIAGLALLERARVTQAAIAEFEGALYGLGGLPPARVTLAASEGILTYTLIPVLLGKQGKAQPLSLDALRSPLPTLAFTTQSSRADIALMATGAGDLPPVAGAVKVRRVGTMHFKPVVGRRLIEGRASGVSSYDEFSRLPLLDIAIYRPLPSLAEWNDLVISRGADETVTSTPSSPIMHKALVEGKGAGILPSYSPLYDDEIIVLDFPAPSFAASLWLVAHEDALREPSVRDLYDGLAGMFQSSPWFRETA